MSEAELFRLLQRLGIDHSNLRALALLPLVEVAWADGDLGPRERECIEKAARELALPGEGQTLLQDWLTFAPSPAYLHAGRRCLSWFARSSHPELTPAQVQRLPGLARKVASAEGGWLGFRAVCDAEREALDRIAAALEEEPAALDPGPAGIVPLAHPDFSRKLPQVTLTEELGAEREPHPAVLVPEFARHQRVRLPSDGAVVGSAASAHCRLVADDIAPRHCSLSLQGSVWVIAAEEGPLWINGERSGRRRLLGGELLRLSASTALWFKLLKPAPLALPGRAAPAALGGSARAGRRPLPAPVPPSK